MNNLLQDLRFAIRQMRHSPGKIVRIDKHPYTVVGVTPQGFYGTEKFIQPDLFVPVANEASWDNDWLNDRRNGSVWSIVRMKDGVTLPRAQAELNTIAARIRRQHPGEEEKLAFKLVRPGLVGDFFGPAIRGFLAGVMGLAGILLLAACANLGSLFAARTADRTREIAIRLAIGSSRWRILRQLLTEAFLISIIGGACACDLSWIALSSLATWRPPTPFPFQFHVLPQPSLIKADPKLRSRAAALREDLAGPSVTCFWRPRSRSAASPSWLPSSLYVALAMR